MTAECSAEAVRTHGGGWGGGGLPGKELQFKFELQDRHIN